MIIVKAAAVLLANFIMYIAFGSFFCVRKDRRWSVAVTAAVGFFAYYALFFVFCLPIMFTYRPLTLLARIWLAPCLAALAVSSALFGRLWIAKTKELTEDFAKRRSLWICVMAVTMVSVCLAVITYSFTLDAAYYVANVATNVDTDMINVYDPFTGSWQDHFELRYVFASYFANDAVICRLAGLPALVQTKTVMSATVMIIVNMLYMRICGYFFKEHRRALLMYVFMTGINFMFISLYTASNFLMMRTYEGKSVVANISVILIFIIFMELYENEDAKGLFLMLFIVCTGTATVSSTANMVIPAEVFALFVPYSIAKKKPGILAKIVLCILPELVMMLVYVLYVKGYFAVYTFPRQ
ncbi:MAG: hypothetical protein K6F73_10090 [Lachnospiraceae bacterium]|nr:hypothetical protein [Lachnospiraceae bacterium]